VVRGGGTIYLAWVFASAYIIAMAVCFNWRFRTGKWKRMRVIEAAPGAGHGDSNGDAAGQPSAPPRPNGLWLITPGNQAQTQRTFHRNREFDTTRRAVNPAG
jgi:hypothetical protein